jgi:hypothetical protein
MTPKVICPKCQRKLVWKDGILGKRVKCPKCNHVFRLAAPSTAADQNVVEAPPILENSWSPPNDSQIPQSCLPSPSHTGQLVTAEPQPLVNLAPDGRLSVQWSNAKEARAVVKELRQIKKRFALEKRQIAQEQRAIRASYTHAVRQQGSKMRGGGFIGKIVRTAQTISRDQQRAALASMLAPYEDRRQGIESKMLAIDDLIHQVEWKLLQGS